MYNFISALKYLSENKVVHRDLKPENLILATKGDDYDVKIADFGLASFLTEEEKLLYLRCGSPGYVSPELLNDLGYDCQADVFSAGVIMYVMLTGRPLFRGDNPNEILQKNQACELDFPQRYWDKISAEAKDLALGLLKKDPKERFTAAQALEHEWFNKEFINESVLELSDLQIRDITAEETKNTGGDAAKLLITCTPVMAGRKL